MKQLQSFCTVDRIPAIIMLIALALLFSCTKRPGEPFAMTFIGQDAFAFNAGNGAIVVSDPYQPGSVGSGIPKFPAGYDADAVTVSHGHPDHNYTGGIAGTPKIIRTPGTYRFGDLTISVYQGYEGKPTGLSSMKNLICVFERDGAKVVHLGDSGIVVDPAILAAIANADAVIVNIDDYVIPQEKIMPFMDSIRARTVVPVHWEGLDQLARFVSENGGGKPVVRSGSVFLLSPNLASQILVIEPLGFAMPANIK